MLYTNGQLNGKYISTKNKDKVIAFGGHRYRPLYKLAEVKMKWVNTATYLG